MMRRLIGVVLLSALPGMAMAADAGHPEWAFPVADPMAPRPAAPADPNAPVSVPGSKVTFTRAQLADPFKTFADWFPDEHPANPPEIVTLGRGMVRPCGTCHAPHGLGHPESANLTGLTAEYQNRQWAAMKSGQRKAGIMNGFAANITEADMKAASDYFAMTKPAPWTKVIESATAPKSYVGVGNLRRLDAAGGTEQLGTRIIEVADNGEQTGEIRNPHSAFTAYVPVGSIAKGKALVETGGNGKTTACAICHGEGLKGLANVPYLAGRSPIMVAREIYMMKAGDRQGADSGLMMPVVAKLTDDDIVNISAYVASLKP